MLSTGQYPDAFLESIDRTNKREKYGSIVLSNLQKKTIRIN